MKFKKSVLIDFTILALLFGGPFIFNSATAEQDPPKSLLENSSSIKGPVEEMKKIELIYLQPKQLSFEFKKVCATKKLKHLEVMSLQDMQNLDCMGTVINLGEACLELVKKERLEGGFDDDSVKVARGIGIAAEKKIICELAKGADLMIDCKRAGVFDASIQCQKPELACRKLKKIYAVEIPLWRSSKTEEKGQEYLHCQFELPEIISL